jgi:hypothetical protein
MTMHPMHAAGEPISSRRMPLLDAGRSAGTPAWHPRRKAHRGSIISSRTLDAELVGIVGHAGYAASQRARKRIEEAFGWIKTVAGLRKTRFRGLDRVGWSFALAAAAYNLVRLPRLLAEAG